MDSQLTTAEREPARLFALLGMLVSAVIVILVRFGIAVPDGLDGDIKDLIQIIGAIAVIAIPYIQGELTRRKVVPVAKVPGASEDYPYPGPTSAARPYVSTDVGKGGTGPRPG